ENEALWDVQSDSEIYGINGAPPFSNTGELRKSASAGVASIGVAGSYPVNFSNLGLVTASSGVLRFFGSGSLAGQYVTAVGASIEFVGGTWTQPQFGTAVFSGAGSAQLTGGTIQLRGQIPNLHLTAGTVCFLPDFQAAGAITNLVLNGATLSGSNLVIGRASCHSLTGPLT